MNKTKDGWYTPLAAQFQGIDEPMPLARFAAIEAVLHLLALNVVDELYKSSNIAHVRVAKLLKEKYL